MSDDFNVVHVSPAVFGLDGVFGGAERYIENVARALQAVGLTKQKIVAFTTMKSRIWEVDGIIFELLQTDSPVSNQMNWF